MTGRLLSVITVLATLSTGPWPAVPIVVSADSLPRFAPNHGTVSSIADSVVRQFGVPVRMRDGVTLYADVYRPAVAHPVPVVLERTPYMRTGAGYAAAGRRWASLGYAYVVQDVRGRGDSEGVSIRWRRKSPTDSIPRLGQVSSGGRPGGLVLWVVPMAVGPRPFLRISTIRQSAR